MSCNTNSSIKQQNNQLFSQEEVNILSKLRIVQKNLVHVQGFPASISNTSLLLQREYFGQYGHIIKLVLTSKTDSITKKETQSAYITYSSSQEAALAVLSLDSIIINGHFIRAFFGTSKYCVHFLNNTTCYNRNKCLYVHYLAPSKDLIGSNCNFDYEDHLILAREISGIDIQQVRERLVHSFEIENSFFPTIHSFISKDKYVHLPLSSISNNRQRYEHSIYKSKERSRFFDCTSSIDNNSNYIPDYILRVIDELVLRFSFFKHFSDSLSLENYEKEYCKAKYHHYTEDSWYKFIFNH